MINAWKWNTFFHSATEAAAKRAKIIEKNVTQTNSESFSENMTALKEATNVEIILGAKEFFVTTIETSTLKGVIILDWIFYKIAITISLSSHILGTIQKLPKHVIQTNNQNVVILSNFCRIWRF